jgi:CRP-like cAMP-binding protein
MNASLVPTISRTRRLGRQTASLVGRLAIPLLRDLNASEVCQVLSDQSVKDYGTGDVILAQGDRRSEMFVIVSERVRVAVSDGINERHVGEMGAGACFGQMELLTGEAASASVTAITACTLLVVCEVTFRAALAQSPGAPAE